MPSQPQWHQWLLDQQADRRPDMAYGPETLLDLVAKRWGCMYPDERQPLVVYSLALPKVIVIKDPDTFNDLAVIDTFELTNFLDLLLQDRRKEFATFNPTPQTAI